MKLSTQLLKRAWDDHAPEFDKRLERYAQNLIEQIDALSHIATAFSNFAKMPHSVNEEVELSELIKSALDFHRSEDLVELSFIQECPSPCLVLADREQLLRVFNNLLRNAIQAISEDRPGKIEIRLYKKDSFYEIEISDNGIGIPDELRSKIFNPNFTTKTTGMGLGLALVKNTLENFNGKVRFESESGIGTTFFVSLPINSE
jgi:signal transduction histidine kinase